MSLYYCIRLLDNNFVFFGLIFNCHYIVVCYSIFLADELNFHSFVGSNF